jgi:hypothetical protein
MEYPLQLPLLPARAPLLRQLQLVTTTMSLAGPNQMMVAEHLQRPIVLLA